MTPEEHDELVEDLYQRCVDDPDFLENRIIELVHFNGDNLWKRYQWGVTDDKPSDTRGLLGPKQL